MTAFVHNEVCINLWDGEIWKQEEEEERERERDKEREGGEGRERKVREEGGAENTDKSSSKLFLRTPVNNDPTLYCTDKLSIVSHHTLPPQLLLYSSSHDRAPAS